MLSTAEFQRIHTAIKKARGKASDYTCACGRRGAEWALLGRPGDYRVPYNNKRGFTHVNADPEAYTAMCLRCHKLYDRMPHPEQVFCYWAEKLFHDLLAGMPFDLWMALMELTIEERDEGLAYEKAALEARASEA